MTEGKELAHRDEGTSGLSQTGLMIREALLNPNINAESAKVMADLLNTQEDRALAAEFNRDLNAAIMEMPVITKAGIITIPGKDGNPGRTQGRFARFEDIDRVVRPILNRYNLAVRFDIDESPKGVAVRAIITHRNGHTERGGAMHMPLDTSGAKNNVQGAGSAVTYAKRYLMCAAFNIITEGTDDDGSLGKFAIDMPHERTVAVLEQAEEAHSQDRYAEWFMQQGVKDRAWLVSSGHHDRMGGAGPLIAGPTPSASPPPPPPPPSPPPPPRQTSGHDLTTAAGWAAQFKEDCRAAKTIDDLMRVKTKGDKALGKLSENDTKLYDECDAEFEEARERLTNT